MKIFSFIFARGGSKTLPKKNIKHLGGMPLIAHSIKLANKIEEINEVFVSSDSNEILELAKDYGAKTILRPKELATDEAPEWLAWKHAVQKIKEEYGDFDLFLSLPATAPLRLAEDVKECIAQIDQETDVVITVTPSSRSPHFNMIYRKDSGESEIILGDSNPVRRQDAPVVYDITTVAYVTRPSYILEKDGVFSGRVKSVVVPKDRAVDIDDELDFLIAETYYERNNKSQK